MDIIIIFSHSHLSLYAKKHAHHVDIMLDAPTIMPKIMPT